MDKINLAKAVKVAAGITYQEAKLTVDVVFQVMSEALRTGEAVSIRDFAHFDVIVKPQHAARNPQTGALMMVPPKRAVRVKLSSVLKALVAQPREEFE